MLSRVGRFLAIAATPVALTILLAQPGRAAEEDAHAATAEHGHYDGHPIKNVIELPYGKVVDGHAMPPPFAAQVFNFLAFAWLVLRFAGPGIRNATRNRHDEIARALAESSRLRDEARARLEEYDRKLAGLQQEIDRLVAGIRGEAEAEKKRIIAEAEARADRMRRDAEQQIAAEMQRVRTILEREAVVAAVSIAERLLKEKTQEADQRALADRFVKGLQDAAATQRTSV